MDLERQGAHRVLTKVKRIPCECVTRKHEDTGDAYSDRGATFAGKKKAPKLSRCGGEIHRICVTMGRNAPRICADEGSLMVTLDSSLEMSNSYNRT